MEIDISLLVLRILSGAAPTTPPTTASTQPTTTPFVFAHPWADHKEKQCYGKLGMYPEGSNLPIGACLELLQFGTVLSVVEMFLARLCFQFEQFCSSG